MADRNFPSGAYALLDECRTLAEAGRDEMDVKAQELVAAIEAGSWGFFGRRAAKDELRSLVENCRRNSEMARDWAQQSGDETLRRQAQCFNRLANTLAATSLS